MFVLSFVMDSVNLVTLFFKIIESTFGFEFLYILSGVMLALVCSVRLFKKVIGR